MPKRDSHKYRRGEPDFTMLVRNDNGQITHNLSLRKGPCAQAYVELREWCWNNEVNFSDLINSIIEPLLHFCCNFARRDVAGDIIITLNFGDVKIEQVYRARTPMEREGKKIGTRIYDRYAQRKGREKQPAASRITLI